MAIGITIHYKLLYGGKMVVQNAVFNTQKSL